jgi:multiple sugar transport system ATP-binding protein
MNIFRARIDVRDGRPILRLQGQDVGLPEGFFADRRELAARAGREVAVGIRPEHLQDGHLARPDYPRLTAPVSLVETLGAESHVHLQFPAHRVTTDEVMDVMRDIDPAGAKEFADMADQPTVRAIACFDADTDVTVGDACVLALVPHKLRFFDLESGTALT